MHKCGNNRYVEVKKLDRVIIECRKVVGGKAEGEALISVEPISFLGSVNTDTGEIVEKGHALEGQNIKDKIFVFPHGKGSTASSYAIYRMAKLGTAPAAIINTKTEPIIAMGALVGKIPLVDKPNISLFGTVQNGDHLIINADEGTIEILGMSHRIS
jgi:predicted aconitase with swiveling domain